MATINGISQNYDVSETHFPSFDDRVRASSRNVTRNGRVSPTHSAHGVLIRSNLMKITNEKKAKKVRFYRNGDRFFKGMVYAVSPERFRTFESLLADLTVSPVFGDKTVLPKGVRHIFSLDGTKKITEMEELEEGESYVCASTQAFHKIDYPKSKDPNWNHPQNQRAESREGLSPPVPRGYDEEDVKEFVKPKLVTVIRNGAKPRKAVRILLNRKTAHSYEQVLTDITETIKMDRGAVRKVFTVSGQPVTTLQDFFGEETVFIAYGNEKYALDDFDMDDNEIRFVSAYRSVRNKERITLRSPKAPRRVLSTSSRPHQNASYDIPPRPSTGSSRLVPVSPKSPRKGFSRAGNVKLNGHHTNGNGPGEPPAKLIQKYKIGKVIGEGNFAIVRECEESDHASRNFKQQYALKIINKAKCKGREQMIENEVSILRLVKHSNIIQLMEEYDTPTELYLIMELVTGGDLFDAIAASTKYTERDASGMIYNLASAIRYLHTLNIVHRDIKPENILVNEHSDGTMSLKLGDFGLAIEVHEPLYSVCGTPTYVAPEVISEVGYGIKIDVWSAGVILYILLCGFPPFVSPQNKQDELFERITAGRFEFTAPFWDEISNSAKELISHMLQVDPDDRFSAEEVLEHPWVSDDAAKDSDMHNTVTKQLAENFFAKKPRKGRPGVALITSTALDKASRFFPGTKGSHFQKYTNGGDQDEVF